MPAPKRVALSCPDILAMPTCQPAISPAPLSGSLLLTASNWKPAAPEKESLSRTEVLTGTSLLFGGQSTLGDALQASVGGVLSMLISLILAVALLPAMSVAAPARD